MARKKYHITKTDAGWQGKLGNGQRASINGSTKAEVLQATIKMAKNNNNSQIIIHGSNGRFQEERTYPRSIDPKGVKS